MADKDKGGVVAFDLDGTLAMRQEPFNPYSVGEPIQEILDIALEAHEKGRTVCFTARANSKDPGMHRAVREWLDRHGLTGMKITNIKTPDIKKFYDDRAVGVTPDKGELLTKVAAEMVKKKYMVEKEDDHCPHCDHRFTEKGYPRPDFEQAEREGIEPMYADHLCPACKGIVDDPEMSDDRIENYQGFGGESMKEILREQREKKRTIKANRAAKKAGTGFPTAWGKTLPAPLPSVFKQILSAAGKGVGKLLGEGPSAAYSAYQADVDPKGVQAATNQAWNDAGTLGDQVQTAVGGVPGKVLGNATTGGLRALGALDPVAAMHTDMTNKVDAAGPDPALTGLVGEQPGKTFQPSGGVPALRVPLPKLPTPSKPAPVPTPTTPTGIAAPMPSPTPAKKASTSPENVSVPGRGRTLVTYVPITALEAVKQHGLLSGNELAKPENRALLELARNVDNDDSADAWLQRRAERLKSTPWIASYQGPSVFFGEPDPDRIHAMHPLKRFGAAKVRINLDALKQDHPDLKLHGVELVKFNEDYDDLTEDEKDQHVQARHHDLTDAELDELLERAKDAKSFWQHYHDPKGERYAGDVPHAQLLLDRIDPKYLSFDEDGVEKQAARDTSRDAFRTALNEAVATGKVPLDMPFYVQGNKCLVNAGDWHEKDQIAAAMTLARKHFKEVIEENECGLPDGFIPMQANQKARTAARALEKEAKLRPDRLKRLGARRGQCPECGGKPTDFEFLETNSNAECTDCGCSFDVNAEAAKHASFDEAQVKSASVQVQNRTGPHGILEALKALNLDDLEKQARADIASGKITKRDRGVKMLNALEGLRRNDIKPEELMIKRVPVLPPAFRPFSFMGTSYIPGDANELYQDLFKHRAVHEETLKTLGEGGAAMTRLNLLHATRALYGYGDPVSPKLKERGPKGYLDQILNDGPKHSIVQRRLLSKPIDNVGRSVITVDPDLGLDEVSIPRDMAWTLAGSKVQRRLAFMGMSPAEAIKAVKDRDAYATRALELEIKENPFLVSRAPAWHKFNAVGQYARLHDGPHIAINPYITAGQNADFDGDQINISLPILADSSDEVKKKLMASKMLFSIKNQDNVVPLPKHEQILGIWTAAKRPSTKVHSFASGQEALAGIRRGDVKLEDEIEIPDV